MSIAVILLAAGLVAGLARGGRVENLGRATFRYPALVFAGLGIQVASELVAALIYPQLREGGRGLALLGLSYLLLVVFVVLNRRLPGAILIGAGLALNLLVIVGNGGMPVSPGAARAAGIDPTDYLERAVKHRPLGPGTVFGFLGDVIPLPVIGKVVSIGDVLLGIGLFVLVERVVRYRPRRLKGSRGAPARGGAR